MLLDLLGEGEEEELPTKEFGGRLGLRKCLVKTSKFTQGERQRKKLTSRLFVSTISIVNQLHAIIVNALLDAHTFFEDQLVLFELPVIHIVMPSVELPD